MPLRTTRGDPGAPTKGRGAPSNLEGRFEAWTRAAEDDGWARDEEALPPLRTHVLAWVAKPVGR